MNNNPDPRLRCRHSRPHRSRFISLSGKGFDGLIPRFFRRRPGDLPGWAAGWLVFLGLLGPLGAATAAPPLEAPAGVSPGTGISSPGMGAVTDPTPTTNCPAKPALSNAVSIVVLRRKEVNDDDKIRTAIDEVWKDDAWTNLTHAPLTVTNYDDVNPAELLRIVADQLKGAKADHPCVFVGPHTSGALRALDTGLNALALYDPCVSNGVTNSFFWCPEVTTRRLDYPFLKNQILCLGSSDSSIIHDALDMLETLTPASGEWAVLTESSPWGNSVTGSLLKVSKHRKAHLHVNWIAEAEKADDHGSGFDYAGFWEQLQAENVGLVFLGLDTMAEHLHYLRGLKKYNDRSSRLIPYQPAICVLGSPKIQGVKPEPADSSLQIPSKAGAYDTLLLVATDLVLWNDSAKSINQTHLLNYDLAINADARTFLAKALGSTNARPARDRLVKLTESPVTADEVHTIPARSLLLKEGDHNGALVLGPPPARYPWWALVVASLFAGGVVYGMAEWFNRLEPKRGQRVMAEMLATVMGSQAAVAAAEAAIPSAATPPDPAKAEAALRTVEARLMAAQADMEKARGAWLALWKDDRKEGPTAAQDQPEKRADAVLTEAAKLEGDFTAAISTLEKALVEQRLTRDNLPALQRALKGAEANPAEGANTPGAQVADGLEKLRKSLNSARTAVLALRDVLALMPPDRVKMRRERPKIVAVSLATALALAIGVAYLMHAYPKIGPAPNADLGSYSLFFPCLGLLFFPFVYWLTRDGIACFVLGGAALLAVFCAWDACCPYAGVVGWGTEPTRLSATARFFHTLLSAMGFNRVAAHRFSDWKALVVDLVILYVTAGIYYHRLVNLKRLKGLIRRMFLLTIAFAYMLYFRTESGETGDGYKYALFNACILIFMVTNLATIITTTAAKVFDEKAGSGISEIANAIAAVIARPFEDDQFPAPEKAPEKRAAQTS